MTVPEDVVDRITAAWHVQLPELDVEPMHVFSRLHRLADHIEGMRREAFSSHGLAVWQFDVLAALRRAGAPYELTPGRLVAETHVSSGTMTNRIDRLVERGLVERRGSDDDRRIVLVRLSADGRDAVDRAVADLVTRERELLDAVEVAGAVPGTGENAAELATLLRAVLQRFEEGGRP